MLICPIGIGMCWDRYFGIGFIETWFGRVEFLWHPYLVSVVKLLARNYEVSEICAKITYNYRIKHDGFACLVLLMEY